MRGVTRALMAPFAPWGSHQRSQARALLTVRLSKRCPVSFAAVSTPLPVVPDNVLYQSLTTMSYGAKTTGFVGGREREVSQ